MLAEKSGRCLVILLLEADPRVRGKVRFPEYINLTRGQFYSC